MSIGSISTELGCPRQVRFTPVATRQRTCRIGSFVPEGDMVGRRSSAKTFNVAARHGGIASRSGRDTDRVNYVRHSAVGAFPHVHHHRGYRLAYSASPEKRERALLALLNVLFSRHCR